MISTEGNVMEHMAEFFQNLAKGATGAVHTVIPGRVVKYYNSPPTVDVQIATQFAFYEYESEQHVQYTVDVLKKVPLAQLGSTSKGIALQWALDAGDCVLLLVAERSVDEFVGSSGGVVQPKDLRRFSLSDAIAIPLHFSFGDALEDLEDEDAVVLRGADIRLGTGVLASLQAVALAQKVADEFDDFKSKYNTHTHAYVTPSIPGPLANTAPTLTLATIPTTGLGSSTVKAEE